MAFVLNLNSADQAKLDDLARAITTTKTHAVELLVRVSDQPDVRNAVAGMVMQELMGGDVS